MGIRYKELSKNSNSYPCTGHLLFWGFLATSVGKCQDWKSPELVEEENIGNHWDRKRPGRILIQDEKHSWILSRFAKIIEILILKSPLAGTSQEFPLGDFDSRFAYGTWRNYWTVLYPASARVFSNFKICAFCLIFAYIRALNFLKTNIGKWKHALEELFFETHILRNPTLKEFANFLAQ